MKPDEQLPPQNLQAEQCVLGCQLVGDRDSEDKFSHLPNVLELVHFYSDVHRTIQKAIWRVRDRSGAVDAVLVADELESLGKLEEIGGAQYLLEVMQTVPHSAHILHYAELIARDFRRRQAIQIGEDMIRKAYDPTKSDQEFIEDAHDSAMRMAQILKTKSSRPRPIKELAFEAVEMLERGESPKVYWGVREIVDWIGGYTRGNLIVMGARARHGKSMIALQWLDCAAKEGISGMMISEEMLEMQLATRTLMYLSELTEEQQKLDPAQVRRDTEVHFQKRATVLVASRCKKIASVERAIARAVQSHGVQIVAVDYAQIIDGDGDSEEQRISNVSKRMKQAAMDHNIVVILLAQLNRQVETRDNPKPRLSDLKGSGGLEADADIVLLPYWPWRFDEDYTPRSEYRIVLAKHRSGSTEENEIQLKIDPARQRLLQQETLFRDPSDQFN